MRIEWNGASAREIAADLDRIQDQLTDALQKSKLVRQALETANPSGDNKRLNAIVEEFERVVLRLRGTEAEAERLRQGTWNMIEAFENAEREAIEIMEGLDVGNASNSVPEGRQSTVTSVESEIQRTESPIVLPPTVIGPHRPIGLMGPMPTWLAERMARYYARLFEHGI
jgi:hypothetical protein